MTLSMGRQDYDCFTEREGKVSKKGIKKEQTRYTTIGKIMEKETRVK